MTSQRVKAEAHRLLDDAIRSGSDLHLTEYMTEARYREDHPQGRPLAEHNAIMRATMREAALRGIYCRRRLVR